MPKVERYGPGRQTADFAPGDFGLTHRHGLYAGLISLAQKRRFRGDEAAFAHWSHAALIVAPNGDLVEAEATGVRRRIDWT